MQTLLCNRNVQYWPLLRIFTYISNCVFTGAVTFLDTPCPPGRYCPQGTTHGDENLCPARSFFNVTGAKDLADCLLCLPGMYCEVDGLSMPTALCDPGQFFNLHILFRMSLPKSFLEIDIFLQLFYQLLSPL